MNWYKEAEDILVDQQEVDQWIKKIEKNPEEYNNCPFKNLNKIKEITIHSVFKYSKKSANSIDFNKFTFLYELIDSCQDMFINLCADIIPDKSGFSSNFALFNQIYKKFKSTSLGQKLRRELIKVLFNKIKENPDFYYEIRIRNSDSLDSDLSRDIEIMGKYLKLPISNPKFFIRTQWLGSY